MTEHAYQTVQVLSSFEVEYSYGVIQVRNCEPVSISLAILLSSNAGNCSHILVRRALVLLEVLGMENSGAVAVK